MIISWILIKLSIIKQMIENIIIKYPKAKKHVKQNLKKKYCMTKEKSIKNNMKILDPT